jgi:hypothetical protein
MLMTIIGIHPIDALFWTAVLNGFVAAPLLMPIMRVANSIKLEREQNRGRLGDQLLRRD